MTIALVEHQNHKTDDLKLMVQWLNDPENVRYSEQRHKKHDVESQQQYIFDHPGIFRTIWADAKLVGTITAYVDRNNSVADVGILIGKAYWGKGYGTEAWAGFCDHLLNYNGIRKIEAGCMSGNHGMRNIFKKYGMILEGWRPKHFLYRGWPCDMEMYGKFNEAV